MIRNRPSKRPGASSLSLVSGSGSDHSPETSQQSPSRQLSPQSRNRKKRYRTTRFGLFIRSLMQQSKYMSTCLLVSLVATLLVFVSFMSQRSSSPVFRPKWTHHHYLSETLHKGVLRSKRGVEVSPLTKGVSILLPKPFFAPSSTHFVELEPFGRHRIKYSKERYYGGLHIKFPENEEQRMEKRIIYHDFDMDRGYMELTPAGQDDDDAADYYYAFDDDTKRNPLNGWDDDKIQNEKQCRRTSWHRDLPIDCNKLHEFDVQGKFLDGSTKYLGAGAYREVYLSELPHDQTVVFKAYYWGSDFKTEDFEFMRMDAIVAERLTWSPKIVDIYGFCGLGMINEAMGRGELTSIALPGPERIAAEDLHDEHHLDVKNKLTGELKLKYSLEMAEAVALLHGFPDGVIVHDDIQLSQFLFDKKGNLKLNDFNRAEIMLFNEKDQEYCKYRNNPGRGEWRAPEEYWDYPLDEKIDVWSLGNNMYALLTGLSPFYLTEHTKDIQKKIKHREIPFIDERYHDRSFAEGKLADIIELCYAYHPADRIDIFTLVKLLREAYEENEKLKKEKKQ